MKKNFYTRIYLTIFIFVASYTGAFSAAYTWNGASGSNWNVNANWLPNTGFPGANDTAIFTNATATTVNLALSATANRIRISGAGNVTVTGAFTQTLTNGIVFTSTGNLIIGNGAATGITAGATTVPASNTVTVSTGATLTASGAFTVNGTITNGAAGVACGTVGGAGGYTFNASSTYNHAGTGGTIPTATWNAASTCNVTGSTGAAPAGLIQSFGNFTWNCTGQTANLTLINVANTTKTFGGTFTVQSTSTFALLVNSVNASTTTLNVAALSVTGGTLQLSANGNATTITTLNVTGAATVSTGSTASLIVNANTNAGSAGTLTVAGSLTVGSSGTLTLTNNAGAGTVNANGTFTQSGGTVQLGSGAGLGLLNASSTVSQSAGVITMTGTNANSRLVFNGASGNQNATFVSGTGLGTGANVEVNKASGSVLLQAATTLPGANLLLTSGTLDLNGNALTFATGLTITRTNGFLSTDGGSYVYSGTINVTYNTVTASITTGPEIPANTTALNNLIVNPGAGFTVSLASTAAVNGNLTVSTGTFDLTTNTANRQTAGGTLTVVSTLNIGGTNTMPSNYTTYTLTGSTVVYYGTNQTVSGGASISYANLTIQGSGTKTLNANTSVVGGNVTVSAGTFDLSTYTLNRSANGGTFSVAASCTLRIGANGFPTQYGTVTLTTGSLVEYYGTANTVSTASQGAIVYSNLLVSATAATGTANILNVANKLTVTGTFTAGAGAINQTGPNDTLAISGTFTAGGNVTVTGSLVVRTTGTFNTGATNNATHTITGIAINNGTISYGATNAETITFSSNLSGNGTINHTGTGTKTLNLNGTDNSGYTGTYTAASGTVNYGAAANQNVLPFSYNTLSFSGSGNRTLLGNTTVAQSMTVPANITLLLNGYTLNNTLNVTVNASGTITTGSNATHNITGTLTLSGTYNLGISANLNNTGNVTINAGSTLTTSTSSTNTMSGTLTLTGAYNLGASAALNITGNVAINAGGMLTTSTSSTNTMSGTLTLAGTYSLGTGSTLTNTGNVTVSAATGSFTTSASSVINLNGTLTVTAGTYTVGPNATLYVNSNTAPQINVNGGTFDVIGTSGNNATVTRTAAGNYVITQATAGSTFGAQYYVFDKLGTNGITISAGSLDPVNNFSNGSFTNGTGTSSLTLTTLNLGAGTTAVNTVFSAGPTYNVTRTAGTGAITFQNYSGALGGQTYEKDNGIPGTLINWVTTGNVFYSQSASMNFSTLASWNSNPLGGGTSPTATQLTNASSSFVVQNGHTVTVDQNINIQNLTTQGVCSLLVGNSTTSLVLTINGNITVAANGVILPGSANALHTLNFYGSTFTNNGVVNLYGSSIRGVNTNFNGTAMTVNGTSSPIFAGVSFNNQSPLYTSSITTAGVSLTIKANVVFYTNANFIDGGYTHYVGGNWQQAAANQMNPATGTINFNSNIFQTISSASTFNNLTFSGGNSPTIGNAIIVNGNFYVTNGTNITTNSFNQTFNGNFTIDNLSTYSQTSNTAIFNGSATQILNANNATFSAITFSGTDTVNVVNNLVANGLVTVNANSVVNGSGSYALGNGLTIIGTCNWNGQLTFTAGNITLQNASNAWTTSAQIVINGNVGTAKAAPATAFALNINNNIIVNAGGLTIGAACTIVGNASYSLNVNVGSLVMNDVNNFPNGFAAVNFATNTNAYYTLNGAQTIRGNQSYYNLYVQNNTKTADNPLTINGTLNFNSTATATILNLGAFQHTIGVNISNANISTINSTGRVTMNNPNANQTISLGIYNIDTLAFTLTAPTAQRTKTMNVAGTVLNTQYVSITATSANSSNGLIVDIGANTITGTSGATFVMTNNTYLYTSGANSLNSTFVPGNFDNILLTDSSTIRYNGYYQTLASGFTYGNIQLSCPDNVNVYRKVVTNTLNISGGVSSNGNTPGFMDNGNNIYVGGSWSLQTANYFPDDSTSGTVILNGGSQQVWGAVNNLICADSGTKSVAFWPGLTIYGNLTINDGVKMDANIRPVYIAGNWTQLGAGIFTQTTGTTYFNGISTSNQNISIATPANSYFGYVQIARGIGTIPSTNITVTALSDFYVLNQLQLNNYNNYPTCSQVTSFANLDITGHNLYVGGNLVIYPTTTLVTTGSTINFNGTGAQNIYLGTASVTFNNLIFSGNGPITIQNYGTNCGTWSNNYVVLGNFTINLSTVNFGNLPLSVAGNWSNTGNFQHTNTVTFNGTNQTISNSTFYNVVFGNSGTKTLTGSITVNQNLTINGTATLDVSPSNYSINVVGSWDNSAAGATFVPRGGTVTFTTSGNVNLNSGGNRAGKMFNYLTIANASCGNTVTLLDSLNIQADLNINAGQLTTGNFDVLVGGSFNNYDQFNQSSNTSQLTFYGSSPSVKTFTCTTSTAGCGVSTYRRININTSGATISQTGTLTVSNGQSFIIYAGKYKLNGNMLSLTNGTGVFTVYSGATADINAGSSLLVVNTVANMGTFRLKGSASQPASFGLCSGCASFQYVQSGTGSLTQALYYQVQSITNGLQFTGGDIDTTYNLSQGSFSGGLGAQYIKFASASIPSRNITAINVVFNTGPTNNVAKSVSSGAGTYSSGTGVITFQNSSGGLAGASSENDSPNSGAATGWIRWTYPGAKYWSGNGSAANTSWNTATNWSPNGVPAATDTVYLDNSLLSASYSVSIDVTDTARAGRLVMQRSGAYSITLSVNAKSLKIGNNLNIGTGSTLNGNTGNIYVANAYSNSGTFNSGTSNFVFNGASGSGSILPGASAFYNLIIGGSSGVTYALAGATTVSNNVTINSGNTLDVSSTGYTMTVGGNWTNNGTFNPRSGTNSSVTFNASSGTQLISGGPFNDLNTTVGGTKQLATNITVYRDINIGTGTVLNAQAFNIYIGRNWNNNATSGFSQTSGYTVYFNGNQNQNIDNGTATTTFNNVTLLGTSTKTLYKSSVINGVFLVAPAGLALTLQTNTLVGNGTTSQFIVSSNSTVNVGGSGSWLSNFTLVSLASNSTVNYVPFALGYDNQSILVLPNNAFYGNLTLSRRAVGILSNKNLTGGNITVSGNLTINDSNSVLNVNGNTITLTGNLAYPNTGGGKQIVWGTGGTLFHNGGNWAISQYITGFNNLTCGGTGTKTMGANLALTGNLIVQTGVTLNMSTFTMTGTGSNTLLLQNSAILQTQNVTTAAFPTGFGIYSLDAGSMTQLNATGNQIVFTTPTYGNLTFSNTIASRSITFTGNLNVANTLNSTTAQIINTTYDINVAGDVYLNDFLISGTGRLILSGDNQNVNNWVTTGTTLNLNKLRCTGTGTKYIAVPNYFAGYNGYLNSGVTTSVSDSFYVAPGITVSTQRPWIYTGTAWSNGGVFNSTMNVDFDGSVTQTIDPGPLSLGNNYFTTINFNNPGTVNFINNGGVYTNAVNISTGTVNFGSALQHYIGGVLSISGTWNTSTSDLVFNGGNQTIPVALTARDVTFATNGTKQLSQPIIVRNLTINSGVTLTCNNQNISASGNWINNGTFNPGTSTVTLNGGSSPLYIQNNVSSFYGLTIAPASSSLYRLNSPNTTVSLTLVLSTGATLKLNGQVLIFGSNTTGKNLTINNGAILQVDTGAFLKFDNRTASSILTVNGTIQLFGSSTNIASITRASTATATGVAFTVNGTIAANNYLIEYVTSNGVALGTSASVDPVNNFSNGTFSNLAAGTSYYINSAMTNNIANSITNVTFNFSGVPVVGTNFNIRQSSIGTITFAAPIYGTLGCSTYDSDPNHVITWPSCNVATWTGAVSTDWNVAGNWSSLAVPDTTTDVTIPLVTNNPIVQTANAKCRNLIITNGILGLASGYTLKVSSDVTLGTTTGTLYMTDNTNIIYVKGNWNRGNAGAFSPGSAGNYGTIQFTSAGSVSINNRTSSFGSVSFSGQGIFNIAAGNTINATANSFSVLGNLTISNGTFVPPAGTVWLQGNMLMSGGTYTNQGILNLYGSGIQNLTTINVSNVTVSGTGTVVTNGACTINGVTNVNSGVFSSASGSVVTFNGNVNILSGAGFNDGGNTHLFYGGTWTGTGSYTGSGGINFISNGNQNINPSNFNSVILSGGGTKTPAGASVLTGNLTVNTVTLNLQNGSSLNRSTMGGTLTANSGSVMNVGGPNNFPSNYSTYNMDCNSTVNYNASAFSQTVAGVNYGILNFSNGGPTYSKLLAGSITTCGTLTINNNTTLDVTSNNYSISVAGDFVVGATNGAFISEQGTVTMNGNGNLQNLNVGPSGSTGVRSFYNLNINNSGGTVQMAYSGPLTVKGNFNVQNGTYNPNYSSSQTFGGNFVVSGTGSLIGTNGNYIFNDSTSSAIVQSNGSIINQLTINSNQTYTLQDNTVINRNLTFNSGTINANGNSVTLGYNSGNYGTFSQNIGGTYTMGAGGNLYLGNGSTLNVTTTGTFNAIGVSGNVVNITTASTGGRYNFNVAGNINAYYYQFQSMSASGISIQATGVIGNRPYNFSEGTFTNGTAGGVYLDIENTQYSYPTGGIDTIVDVSFPVNPGGGARNVAKTTSTSGVIIFNNASGTFAGAAYDNDPNNLIIWVGNPTLTWNGSVSSDWFTAANWTPSFGPATVPVYNENVIIAIATNQPVITNVKVAAGQCKNMTINLGAELRINTTDLIPDIIVNGDLNLNGNLVLNNVQDTIKVTGNWYRGASGSMIPGLGVSVMTASSGLVTINNRTSQFGTLVINGSSTFQLGTALTVNQNLLINNGILDVTAANNYAVSVGGNWINNGTFLPRTGTVTLNSSSSGSVTLNGGVSSSFYNLNIQGSASTIYQVLVNNLTITNNFNLSSGTINFNSFDLTFGTIANGNQAINISGTAILNANTYFYMGSGSSLNVLSGGTLTMVGTGTLNPVYIQRLGAGRYYFNVNNGAKLNAGYYQIEGLANTGLSIRNGAGVGAYPNNLSNGVFLNGASGSGSTYLYFQNDYPVTGSGVVGSYPTTCDTIKNVQFNSGPQYNATRLTGINYIDFKDATGALGGYLYENDDLSPSTGRIRWTYTNPNLTWTGLAYDNDWFNPANWVDAGNNSVGYYPTTLTLVTIPAATTIQSSPASWPVIKAANLASATVANAQTINMLRSSQFSIQDNLSLILTGQFSITGGTFTSVSGSNSVITMAQSMSIVNSTSPTTVNAVFNANNATINVGSSWNGLISNIGTFNPGTSVVNMTASSGTVSIVNGSSSFYKLNLTGTATFQMPYGSLNDLVTLSDFNINSGATFYNATITSGGYTNRNLQIAGNFTNSGTFNWGTAQSYIIFNGTSGTQNITDSIGSLVNVWFQNSGQKVLNSKLSITGTLNIGTTGPSVASNLYLNGKNVNFSGSSLNMYNNASTINHGGAGTFTFSRLGNQQLSISGSVPATGKGFYNLSKTGSGNITLSSYLEVDNNLSIASGCGLDATTSNYNVYIGGNWSNTGTFYANNNQVVFQGTSQTISNTAGETFYNLTCSASSGVTLNNNVTVGNILAFTSGLVNTGTNTLFMTSNTGSVTGAGTSSYVNGTLRKNFTSGSNVSRNFEVGNTQYLPITMVFPSVTTPGNVTVSVTSGDNPQIAGSCLDATKSVNEYWNITNGGVAPASYNATFNYNTSVTDAGVVPANLALSAYSGGAWYTQNVISSSSTSLQSTGITLFGAFEVAQSLGYVWKGNTSTNWFTSSNWCGNALPSVSSNVIINSPVLNMPLIGSSGAVANSLSIGSSATLSLSSSGTLTLYGNYINNGTLSAAIGSTVTFAGASAQTLSGTSNSVFGNLTISNTSATGVTLSSPQSLGGLFSISSGSTFNTGGTFTLVSTATDSVALIGQIPTGAHFSGNITVQRYIPAKRVFRYLSTPVSGATFQQWQANTAITGAGGATNNFDPTITNNPSCFYYDETVQGRSFRGYTGIANTNNTITPGLGYRILIRGDRTVNLFAASPPATNTTLSVTGPMNTGNFNFPVTYTPTVTAQSSPPVFVASANDGWNLVGNPYPSFISWNSASGWTKTNIDNAVYFWDPQISQPSTSGGYVTYVNGISSPSRPYPQIIAPWQGFYIKANASSPVLSINENAKVDSISKEFFRLGTPDNFIRLQLTNADSSATDETVVYFQNGATTGFDGNFDAYKLSASAVGLSSILPSTAQVAINGLPDIESTFNVPLSVFNSSTGSMNINVTEMGAFTDSAIIYLKDNYLGTISRIYEGLSYGFNVTSDTASTGNNRMELTIIKSAGAVTSQKINDLGVYNVNVYPNPVKASPLNVELYDLNTEEVSVGIVDLSGKPLLNKVFDVSAGAYNKLIIKEVSSYPAGAYLLIITSKNGVHRSRFVVQQ